MKSLRVLAFFGVAFFSYEITKGFTKICVYDYIGSAYSITVQSYEFCPYTITVN